MAAGVIEGRLLRGYDTEIAPERVKCEYQPGERRLHAVRLGHLANDCLALMRCRPYAARSLRAPVKVVFTDHAVERAGRYGIAHRDIAEAVLDEHERRRRNRGSGDWVLRRGGLAVIYNWPDGEDAATARVITVWIEG